MVTAGHSKPSNSDAMIVLEVYHVYHTHGLSQRRCAHGSLLIAKFKALQTLKIMAVSKMEIFIHICVPRGNSIIVTFYPNGCSQFENPEVPDFEKIASASRSFSTLSLPLPTSFIKVLLLPQKINRFLIPDYFLLPSTLLSIVLEYTEGRRLIWLKPVFFFNLFQSA